MINVTNEIGTLRKVMLHRPGNELENLTPNLLSRLLFDDIPFLKVARQEHDAFANVLRENGVEVVYIEDLLAQTLDTSEELKISFIKQFIKEADVFSPALARALEDYFLTFSTKEMVDKMIAGVRDFEVEVKDSNQLVDLIAKNYPFITDPLPNLLFQRDPFASVGNGVTINKMFTTTRCRETIFSDYIFTYHPDYINTPKYYNRDAEYTIEGGDELVLSKEVLAIGISQRTSAAAIENLAQRLFESPDVSFKTVLAFSIPKSRAFMHLDTVFTQIDHDKFTVHPGILGELIVYELTYENQVVKVKVVSDSLENILSHYLNKNVKLIKCGGNDIVASEREQWNDGANTLCIRPGVVIVYERNWVTNQLLRDEGITVLEIPSSELSRGRGGPRCMSMPLVREEL